MKKQTSWIALIIPCLSWGAMNCLALDPVPDENLATLLQREVANRQANLE